MEYTTSRTGSSTYPGDDEPAETTNKPRSSGGSRLSIVVIILLALLTLSGGFAAGIQYQKGKSSNSANSSMGQNGQIRGMGQQNGGFGTVIAVSDTSITITQPTMGGPGGQSNSNASGSNSLANKTYTITSSTAITGEGTTVSASDITIGDTVSIQTGSSSSSTATAIQVNPTMDMGGPNGQAATQSGTTPSTSN